MHQIKSQNKGNGFKPLHNKEIMKKISTAIEQKGLTLEQCYRAADSDCDGKLTFEELRKFLTDLKITLPESVMSRFMLIIDEDCSGIIEKKEFYNALTAYQIGKEDH